MKRTSQMLLNLTGSQLGIKSVGLKEQDPQTASNSGTNGNEEKTKQIKEKSDFEDLQKNIMEPLISCSAIR